MKERRNDEEDAHEVHPACLLDELIAAEVLALRFSWFRQFAFVFGGVNF